MSNPRDLSRDKEIKRLVFEMKSASGNQTPITKSSGKGQWILGVRCTWLASILRLGSLGFGLRTQAEDTKLQQLSLAFLHHGFRLRLVIHRNDEISRAKNTFMGTTAATLAIPRLCCTGLHAINAQHLSLLAEANTKVSIICHAQGELEDKGIRFLFALSGFLWGNAKCICQWQRRWWPGLDLWEDTSIAVWERYGKRRDLRHFGLCRLNLFARPARTPIRASGAGSPTSSGRWSAAARQNWHVLWGSCHCFPRLQISNVCVSTCLLFLFLCSSILKRFHPVSNVFLLCQLSGTLLRLPLKTRWRQWQLSCPEHLNRWSEWNSSDASHWATELATMSSTVWSRLHSHPEQSAAAGCFSKCFSVFHGLWYTHLLYTSSRVYRKNDVVSFMDCCFVVRILACDKRWVALDRWEIVFLLETEFWYLRTKVCWPLPEVGSCPAPAHVHASSPLKVLNSQDKLAKWKVRDWQKWQMPSLGCSLWPELLEPARLQPKESKENKSFGPELLSTPVTA